MDRLTIDEAIEHCKELAKENRESIESAIELELDDAVIKSCTKFAEQYEQFAKWFEELKEYQDLEEQGLLLKLLCKIGDNVYQIPSKVNYDLNVLHRHDANNRVYHQKVSKIVLDGEYWYLECDKDREYGTGRICLDRSFGETWFLTKEAAEQALKGMEKTNENNS